MAHLLTCFHTLADPDVLNEEEWIEGCASGTVDFSYVRKTINSFDESALELAGRVKDLAEDSETFLSAATIGDKTNETALRTLAALGFGRVARIDAAIESLTSEGAADILAGWIAGKNTETKDVEHFDLIITGQSSGDWNQAQIPMLIADQLGIKCFTNVASFVPSDDNGAMVTWLTDDALCTAYVAYPAVLSVGDVSGTFLRVPTLRQRMDSKKQAVEVVMADNKKHDCHVNLIDMKPVIERREAILIDGTDAEAAADSMLQYFTGWMEE